MAKKDETNPPQGGSGPQAGAGDGKGDAAASAAGGGGQPSGGADDKAKAKAKIKAGDEVVVEVLRNGPRLRKYRARVLKVRDGERLDLRATAENGSALELEGVPAASSGAECPRWHAAD